MTHDIDSTLLAEAMEQVIEHGMDGLSEAMTILLNEAMRIERSRALQASPWQVPDSASELLNTEGLTAVQRQLLI